THLLRCLMGSLGTVVGAVIETDSTDNRCPRDDLLAPSSIVDCGWDREGDRERFQRLIREGTPARNPILPAVLALPAAVRTFCRRHLLTDDEYYGNAWIAAYIRQTNLDDFVGLFSLPTPHRGFAVGLNRPRRDRPFGRRERRLLHLCGAEVV